MKRAIQHTWFFGHPTNTVWEYLTNNELIAQWLMANDFQPIVGHTFMFDTKPKIKISFDKKIYCKVLEVVPNQRLVYSWRGGPGDGKVSLDSVVTWTLVTKEGGTELHLEHSGFRRMKNFLAYFFMNAGWGGKIKARLTQLMNTNEHAHSKR